MDRRYFLKTLLAAGGTSVLTRQTVARDPIARKGPPRFQMGLAAYSLRNYFRHLHGNPKQPAQDGPPIDMIGLLDYCVRHGFDAAELTSYFFPPHVEDRYFLELRRAAFERGVAIAGTAIGNDFTVGQGPQLDEQVADAIKWIDRARLMGAPHIRFFAGTRKQLQADPQRLDEAIEALHRCAEHAANQGVVIGVENHGQLSAQQCLTIMRRVKSPWIGMNLDTGNFVSDNPYQDLAACAPYAVNIQVKPSMKSPQGKTYPTDLNRVAKILKNVGYQGFVVVEYEDEKPYEHLPAFADRLRDALMGR